jgi:hypothetical protein
LKLTPFPTRSLLSPAALPSMSLLPVAPFSALSQSGDTM